MHHFIEGRSDQTRKTNNVDVFFFGYLEDLLTWDHDAKIDDLVVVTLQNHANNVLTDIVNVTFYRSQQNLTVGRARLLLFINERL